MPKSLISIFYNNRKTILKRYPVFVAYYLTLILVSSVNIVASLVANIVLFVYFARHASKSSPNSYLYTLSVGNFLIFSLMVTSYAELLPWEIGFHTVLYAISAAYIFWSSQSTATTNDPTSKRTLFLSDPKL